jgi:DNA-binding HxlR family transcriptional regulator
MRKKVRTAHRSGCPISIALEIFGDSWSLLIVRDLMFKGLSTFNELSSSGEGVASNVLTERLLRLEAAGILVKEPDPTDGRRSHYRLTEKGADLAPALVEIVLWAARHEDTEAPARTVRTMRTHREQFIADVRKRCLSWRGAA